MFNTPLLGGFDAKVAGAYLLPPKPKKKKPEPADELEALDKEAAALAEAIVFQKQAELQRRLHAGDLGGGWNPYDQINPAR